MVVVSLTRRGNRNRPYFFIVVADSHARLQGRFIEKLGYHNPLLEDNNNDLQFRIDMSRLEHWIGAGAQISLAVKKLLKIHNIAAANTKADAL